MSPKLATIHKPIWHKQTGVAIFMAMLVVALVSALTITLTYLSKIDNRRTQLLLTQQQAYRYADGVSYWALGLINQYQTTASQIMTSHKELVKWPQQFPETTIPNGSITGEVSDYQNGFNINNLTAQNHFSAFKQLLSALDTNLSSDQATDIAKAISAWISPTATTYSSPTGFTDDIYLQANPPYRAAHRPMVFPSELRLIKAISARQYHLLLPQLRFLPTGIKTYQTSSPATSKADEADGNKAPQATFVSVYYLVHAKIQLNNQTFNFYRLIIKQPQNPAKTIWENFGDLN